MRFEMKCPYCKGKNLYTKRTSPVVQYGCHNCEKEIDYLKSCGLTMPQIKRLFAIKLGEE